MFFFTGISDQQNAMLVANKISNGSYPNIPQPDDRVTMFERDSKWNEVNTTFHMRRELTEFVLLGSKI